MKYGLDMMMKSLSEDKGAAQIFDRILPGMRQKLCANPAAANLSIRQVAGYAKGMIPEEALVALDKELQEYGANRGLTPAEQEKVAYYRKLKAADDARWAKRVEDTRKTDSTGQAAPAKDRYDCFHPGQVWYDTDGNRIQAHGGAIFYENGMYYWYGENKEHTTADGDIWTWGIRAYRSEDLYNWEDMGLIIEPDVDDPSSNLFPDMHVDRPHIRKSEATGKYVAWIKLSGIEACFLIMQADRFTGPYKVVHENYYPLECKVGDFDIVTDAEDGSSYLYFDADHAGIVCARMSEDLLCVEKEMSRSYTGLHAPFCREGVAMMERKGKKYMLTSGMTGYVPNQSDAACAGCWTEAFVSIGDPYVEDETMSSFNSQFTQIFKVPGKEDLYIALSDRWVPEYPVTRERADLIRRVIASRYDPEHYNCTDEEREEVAASPMLESADTSIADYVWLPLSFEGDQIQIRWLDNWGIENYN